MTESLSPSEARKLAILSQSLLENKNSGRAKDVTFEALEKLGYVQIDTISVVQRAHLHTFWNRNRRFKEPHLNELLKDQKIFEYWSHAAAFLPLSDYRYSLPNKLDIKGGRKQWYECDQKIKRQVYDRIKNEGPLQSKDFENHGHTKLPMWEWKPAKYALEQLFMEGEIMVARREGFQKVYEITERVLPDSINTTVPTRVEYARHLITRYIQANGFGDASEIGYLRTGMKKIIQEQVADMLKEGELIEVSIKKQKYLTTESILNRLNQRFSRSRAKILSPFDNLVIQRKRIHKLFDFDYQIECYVPESKRKHGYFCLPILWDGRLVARMDCKADRKTSTFLIKHLIEEPSLKKIEAFSNALSKELGKFLAFNNCKKLEMESVPNKIIKKFLKQSFC